MTTQFSDSLFFSPRELEMNLFHNRLRRALELQGPEYFRLKVNRIMPLHRAVTVRKGKKVYKTRDDGDGDGNLAGVGPSKFA